MKRGWRCVVVSVGLLLCARASAFAHRLDEYLQATTISVDHEHVAMRLRLAAGVAVASRIVASIDVDGNGIFSEAEKQAYINQVLADLTFRIDGRAVSLAVVSDTFATISEIKAE